MKYTQHGLIDKQFSNSKKKMYVPRQKSLDCLINYKHIKYFGRKLRYIIRVGDSCMHQIVYMNLQFENYQKTSKLKNWWTIRQFIHELLPVLDHFIRTCCFLEISQSLFFVNLFITKKIGFKDQ